MGGLEIKTPLSRKFLTPNGTGKITYSRDFGSKWSEKFNKAQAFVDSEVIRLCSPLVPFQTGNLMRSGTLGTSIGSGQVKYIAPYSHDQYYYTPETRSYDAQRGGKWFERMKTAHKDEIIAGAKKLL